MIIVDKSADIPSIDFKAGAVILVNKPLGWTSFDVVNKIRFALRHKYQQKKFKVGHNGTLDPLATGLLMIFTGKYTKLIPNEENHNKRYIANVKLGATTKSLDRETDEEIFDPVLKHVDSTILEKEVQSFLGKSMQVIPFYSATKVNGVPMYKLARQDKKITKKEKPVEFHSLEMTNYEFPFVEVDILCGKGTYIRAFARDLGVRLDTSAYLYGLERTEISKYHIDNALEVDHICNEINASTN